MILKVVVVDDEERAREVLRHFLSKHADLQVVGEGANGKEALELVTTIHPDLLFLDVKMPVLTGMEAAKIISQLPRPPLIIFTTAYEEHAVGAFEVEALDYLVKPYTVERINMAVERAIARRESEYNQENIVKEIVSRIQASVPRRLSFEVLDVKGDKSEVFVNEESILFAEARGRRTRIVTDKSEYDVNSSLGEVEKWLNDRLFFKSHRSYLVNLNRVSELKATGRTYGIVLVEGARYGLIPLSRERVDELKASLTAIGK